MTEPAAGGGDIQKMSYQEIMPLLHGLEPEQFTAAAQAFTNLGTALENIRKNIEDTGNSIAENKSWRGAAAQKAMTKFQTMHDKTAALANDSAHAGRALEWFGGKATPPFKSIPDPQVLSGWKKYAAEAAEWSSPAVGIADKLSGHSPGGGQDEADQAARSYMTAYNQQMSKLNQTLPAAGDPGGDEGMVRKPKNPGTPPPIGTPPPPGTNPPGTPNPPGVPGYKKPGGPNPFAKPSNPYGNNPPNTPSTPTPHVPAHSTPGVPNDGGHLQGLTPPGGGAPSPFGGGAPGTGGGGANPFSGIPMTGGGFGAGKGASAAEKAAADDAADMAGSRAAAGEEAAGAEAAGAEGAAGGGVPLGGGAGGGGQQDKERQRQAWLSEDESIWGVPDEDVGPIIG